MQICSRVREFRRQIKWPQPGFAAELGITRDQLASIEYGRTPLRYEVAYRLCFLFNVNQEWLATGQGLVTPFTAESFFPFPTSLPNGLLFSAAYDTALADVSKISSQAIHETKRGKLQRARTSVMKGFDPLAFLIEKVVQILKEESFDSELEKQEFAIESAHMLTTMRLQHRHKRVSQQIRSSKAMKGLSKPEDISLSHHTPNLAAEILKRHQQIQALEAEIADLEARSQETRKRK